MSLVDLIGPSFIFNIFQLKLSSVIIKEKIDFKNGKNIFLFILLIVMLSFSTLVFNNFLRVVFNFLCLLFFYYFIHNKGINVAFIVSFIAFFLFFMSEIIFSSMLYFVSQIWDISIDIEKNTLLYLISNISIGFMAIIIYRIKKIKQIVFTLIKNYEKTKFTKTMLIILMLIFVLVNKNFLLFDFYFDYLLNLFIVALFCLIAYLLLKEKNANASLSKKYDQLFSYLENYEKELNKKSIIIHEFNNQLIAIKGFNDKKNKHLEQYLNSIIKDNQKGGEKFLDDMENLPKGGLKGLIYYKLGYLKDEGINVVTDISSTVRKNAFAKFDPSLYRDILKIVGVLLDNAVEAAKESKEKQISLEIFCTKNDFNIVLSNTFCNNIDLEKIDESKYSTKGKDRGYGLALVKQIVKDNPKLQVKKEIINNFFVSTLTIELKNTSN